MVFYWCLCNKTKLSAPGLDIIIIIIVIITTYTCMSIEIIGSQLLFQGRSINFCHEKTINISAFIPLIKNHESAYMQPQLFFCPDVYLHHAEQNGAKMFVFVKNRNVL